MILVAERAYKLGSHFINIVFIEGGKIGYDNHKYAEWGNLAVISGNDMIIMAK